MANREKDGGSRKDKRASPRVLREREQRKQARVRVAQAASLAAAGDTGAWPADSWMVAELAGGQCWVVQGERRLQCSVPPRLAREFAGALAIGDRVRLDAPESTVVERLPRRNHLARKRSDRTRQSGGDAKEHALAANLDLAVVVAAIADPPFHPRLIDRFLIMAQHGGIQPLICLNKCELGEPPPELAIYAGLGVDVVMASAHSGAGLDQLRAGLQGKSSVLVGHSGVGKSSLVNALLGTATATVGAVGQKSNRGRHTTTAVCAHLLDADTYLFDTPGIRSWGLWAIEQSELRDYFSEFAGPAAQCRYGDCTHRAEPGCAVRAAVESGAISAARFDSYSRLFDE
jgi:ribosome biogenesis GTPase